MPIISVSAAFRSICWVLMLQSSLPLSVLAQADASKDSTKHHAQPDIAGTAAGKRKSVGASVSTGNASSGKPATKHFPRTAKDESLQFYAARASASAEPPLPMRAKDPLTTKVLAVVNNGNLSMRRHDFRTASAFYSQALYLAQGQHAKPALIGDCARRLADAMVRRKLPDKAIAYYAIALSNYELAYGHDDQLLDPVLFDIAEVCCKSNRPAEAVSYLDRLVAIRKQLLSPTDRDLQAALVLRYVCLLAMHDRIDQNRKELLALLKTVSPNERLRMYTYIQPLQELANKQVAAGKTEQAIVLYQICLESNQLLHIGLPLIGLNVSQTVAEQQINNKQYKAAELTCLQALKTPITTLKDEAYTRGVLWYYVCLTRQYQQRLKESREAGLKALHYLELLGKNSTGLTSSLLCVAQTFDAGDPRCEQYYVRAVAVNRGKGPSSQLNAAISYLAKFYQNKLQYDKARKVLTDSMSYERAHGGLGPESHCYHLLLLAETYLPQNNASAAAAAISKCAPIIKKDSFSDLAWYARVTVSTAELFKHLQQITQARALLTTVENSIRENVDGGDARLLLEKAKPEMH